MCHLNHYCFNSLLVQGRDNRDEERVASVCDYIYPFVRAHVLENERMFKGGRRWRKEVLKEYSVSDRR